MAGYLFPPESETRLNGSFRNVPARPIAGACLALDGQRSAVRTSPDAIHARFKITLQQGERHRIEGQLLDAAGQTLWGAVYLLVSPVHR